MTPSATKSSRIASLPIMRPAAAMKNAAQLAAAGVYQPPYPWEVPPPGHIARHIMGSVIAPPYGAANQVEILFHVVPANMYFCLAAVMIRYDGTNFTQGSGDVIMSIDLNSPPQPTGTSASGVVGAGFALPDYGQIVFNLGSFDFGAFPLPNRPVFSSGDRLGMKAFTVQNVGVGTTNRFNGMLVGWEWPISQ